MGYKDSLSSPRLHQPPLTRFAPIILYTVSSFSLYLVFFGTSENFLRQKWDFPVMSQDSSPHCVRLNTKIISSTKFLSLRKTSGWRHNSYLTPSRPRSTPDPLDLSPSGRPSIVPLSPPSTTGPDFTVVTFVTFPASMTNMELPTQLS